MLLEERLRGINVGQTKFFITCLRVHVVFLEEPLKSDFGCIINLKLHLLILFTFKILFRNSLVLVSHILQIVHRHAHLDFEIKSFVAQSV